MTDARENDARWAADGKEHGWVLPKTALPWRIWGVRHVRFLYHAWGAERHAAQWASIGIGIGGPNQYDRWVLYAILRGWT
jgi:hypothetical protein